LSGVIVLQVSHPTTQATHVSLVSFYVQKSKPLSKFLISATTSIFSVRISRSWPCFRVCVSSLVTRVLTFILWWTDDQKPSINNHLLPKISCGHWCPEQSTQVNEYWAWSGRHREDSLCNRLHLGTVTQALFPRTPPDCWCSSSEVSASQVATHWPPHE
jgi:hypothetical protein